MFQLSSFSVSLLIELEPLRDSNRYNNCFLKMTSVTDKSSTVSPWNRTGHQSEDGNQHVIHQQTIASAPSIGKAKNKSLFACCNLSSNWLVLYHYWTSLYKLQNMVGKIFFLVSDVSSLTSICLAVLVVSNVFFTVLFYCAWKKRYVWKIIP